MFTAYLIQAPHFFTHNTAYKFVQNNTTYNPPGTGHRLQHVSAFISAHIKFHHMCLSVLLSTCHDSTPASNIVIIFYILLNTADTFWPKADIHNEPYMKTYVHFYGF